MNNEREAKGFGENNNGLQELRNGENIQRADSVTDNAKNIL